MNIDSPRLRFAGRPSLRLRRKEGKENICHAERSEASILLLAYSITDPSFLRMTILLIFNGKSPELCKPTF